MTRTKARACDGKIPHATKQAALDHVFSLRRNGANRRASDAYRCPFGAHWHVGHKPRGGKR